MSFVRNLSGIPLFSTPSEAVAWGKKNLGISGFHAHRYAGQNTYMAGASHSQIMQAQQKRFNESRQGNLKRVPQETLVASNKIQNLRVPRVLNTSTQQAATASAVQLQQPMQQQDVQQPIVGVSSRVGTGASTGGGGGGGYSGGGGGGY